MFRNSKKGDKKKMIYKFDFNEFEGRVKKIATMIKRNKNIKDIFGVPRGGLIAAVRLSHLTGLPLTGNPRTENTAIIDDCIDSGATEHSFSNFKHFYVLVNKQEEGIKNWIDFWWEEK
ncbi:MAG: hypothetical protein ACTSXD_11735 [Candidatus Heimdallarchaeaceae archaeon]